METANPTLIHVERIKYYLMGSKRYAPVIGVMGKRKILRRRFFRTATECVEYGEKVVDRYHNLLAHFSPPLVEPAPCPQGAGEGESVE